MAQSVVTDSPPASNRGANFREIAAHLDYLSCNFGRKDPEFPSEISNDFKPCKPFLSFDTAWENSQGVKVLSHSLHERMGHFVQLSGTTLSNIGADDYSLMTYFVLRAKMRRFDVCVDVRGHNLSLNEIRRQIRAKKAITRAKQFPIRGDVNLPNDTVYAGKMNGDVYTKIYDKGVESGMGGDWKRIETTFQGDRVRPAAATYLRHAGIVGLIRGHFDLPCYPKWAKIMSEEPKHIKADKKTESKTGEWLLNAAAHTLAMYCATHGLEFKNRFDDEFYTVYYDLMHLSPDGSIKSDTLSN